MADDDHRALAEALRAAKGAVVVSGYPYDLYDTELYRDWDRQARQTMANGQKQGVARTEALWLNKNGGRRRRAAVAVQVRRMSLK